MCKAGYGTVVVDAGLVDLALRARGRAVVMPTGQVVLVEVDGGARQLARVNAVSPVVDAGDVHAARDVTVAQHVCDIHPPSVSPPL